MKPRSSATLKNCTALVVVYLLAAFSVGVANAKTDLNGLKLLHVVGPEYPPVARRFNIHGTVVVRLVVESNGHVSKTEILESPADVMSQSVMKVTPQWVFSEPQLATAVTLDIPFTLTETGEPPAFDYHARTLVQMPTQKSELGKKVTNGWAEVRIILTGARSNDFHVVKISDASFRKTVEQIVKRLRFSEGRPALNVLKIRVTDDAPLSIELLASE